MNAEQIRDEIRKLNWIEKIGIYRWINEEVTGDHRIEADRSLKIRLEIERTCRFSGSVEGPTLNAERSTLNAERLTDTARETPRCASHTRAGGCALNR
jgi:hypothetical protein